MQKTPVAAQLVNGEGFTVEEENKKGAKYFTEDGNKIRRLHPQQLSHNTPLYTSMYKFTLDQNQQKNTCWDLYIWVKVPHWQVLLLLLA